MIVTGTMRQNAEGHSEDGLSSMLWGGHSSQLPIDDGEGVLPVHLLVWCGHKSFLRCACFTERAAQVEVCGG